MTWVQIYGYVLQKIKKLGRRLTRRPVRGCRFHFHCFFREKAKTWYSWDFAKWRAKFMFIFRWQAHDPKVKVGISQKRKTNFVIEGQKEHVFRLWDQQPHQQVLFQRHRMVLKFLKSNCFHIWYCGSTCRSMPIWNAWAFTASFILCAPLLSVTPSGVQLLCSSHYCSGLSLPTISKFVSLGANIFSTMSTRIPSS